MSDSQIIEKGKYIMQTINEKWDSMDPIGKTLILCLGILVFLIKIPVLVTFVIVCGFQRILYHIGYFKERYFKEIYSEKDDSHGVKSSIKETKKSFNEPKNN